MNSSASRAPKSSLFWGLPFSCSLNQMRRWHERWISYRLLAELCRKQYVLSSIGQALPRSEVVRMSLDAEAPRRKWRSLARGAAQRAVAEGGLGRLVFYRGAARGALSDRESGDREVSALKLAQSLMAGRCNITAGAATATKRPANASTRSARSCFLLTIVAGAVKLVSLWMEHAMSIALSATFVVFLSAASAAFVGIRAYSEFSLLVEQSKHMLRIMKERGARTRRDRPRSTALLARPRPHHV